MYHDRPLLLLTVLLVVENVVGVPLTSLSPKQHAFDNIVENVLTATAKARSLEPAAKKKTRLTT